MLTTKPPSTATTTPHGGRHGKKHAPADAVPEYRRVNVGTRAEAGDDGRRPVDPSYPTIRRVLAQHGRTPSPRNLNAVSKPASPPRQRRPCPTRQHHWSHKLALVRFSSRAHAAASLHAATVARLVRTQRASIYAEDGRDAFVKRWRAWRLVARCLYAWMEALCVEQDQ